MPKSHPCEGLPPAAVKAFNAIAAGMPPRSSGKTLALLLERGLIHRVARPTYFDDGLPPMVRYEYSLAYPHHIQWCDWAVDGRSRARRRGGQKVRSDSRSEPELPL
jgi:hypothetical protein